MDGDMRALPSEGCSEVIDYGGFIMNASQEMQAVIEALPDPILILAPNRGRVLAYNKAFVDKWGFVEETFMDKPFLKMPQFSRAIQRGLIGIYARARHRRAKIAPFSFCYPDKKGFLKTFSASASPIEEAGNVAAPSVMLRFQELPQTDEATIRAQEDAAAFNIFTDITDEPWLEFRPPLPIIAPGIEDGDRRDQLVQIGKHLRLARASKAAIHFYGLVERDTESADGTIKLKEKDFPSFFSRSEDACRMLDILTTIGFIRARSALLDRKGNVIEAEVSCASQFGQGNSLTAIYCIFHFSEEMINCRNAFREGQQMRDFTFNQPFLGLGQLVPQRPLKRPEAESAEAELGKLVNSILLVATNDALLKLHNAQKSRFLMQPMSVLFPNTSHAVAVLRELFVTRESSFALYDGNGTLQHITIFKAIFNDADELVRILISTSDHSQGIEEHYNNQPIPLRPKPA